MATTTSRLSLSQPVGADPVSELRTAIGANATILDATVMFASGTLVARPAAALDGRIYHATDTGLYYLDTGSAWQTIPVLGGMYGPLLPVSTAVNVTAVAGQCMVVTGSSAVTVTLPANVAGARVRVVNMSTAGTTVSGSAIHGVGLSGASSFPLGTVGASAELFGDGANWYVIDGQQDTGWVAITDGSFQPASGYYAPAIRLLGSCVLLRGAAQNQNGVAANWFTTVQSAFHPAATVQPGNGLSLTTAGVLAGPVIANAAIQMFDNASYSLS